MHVVVTLQISGEEKEKLGDSEETVLTQPRTLEPTPFHFLPRSECLNFPTALFVCHTEIATACSVSYHLHTHTQKQWSEKFSEIRKKVLVTIQHILTEDFDSPFGTAEYIQQ